MSYFVNLSKFIFLSLTVTFLKKKKEIIYIYIIEIVQTKKKEAADIHTGVYDYIKILLRKLSRNLENIKYFFRLLNKHISID